MSPVVSQLWKVLESLGESSQFCTAGSLTPVLPGLEVEGVGNVGVPVSGADARRLIELASQAPYGRGEETIVDTNVRRVWQLKRVVERWDRRRGQDWHQPEPRTGIVESVFRAFAALGEIDRIGLFVGYVLATPKRYDLHTVLIPAVKTLHATLDLNSPARGSFERLLHHCLAELRTLTATPIEPPGDWTRDANIDCKCADCRELAEFLRDPIARVHRFARRKELRQHLHQRIDAHRLDLTHVTERKGSPQTLVCTKTNATYERRKAQFEVDVRLLKELEDVADAPPQSDASPGRRRTKPGKVIRSSTAKPRG